MATPIELIRQAVDREEIDYLLLKSCLKNYASPRDVITRLLREGALIRVKKGLYVFGEKVAKRPFSHEVLANLIFGPSYLSREYALAYYGLLPEAVFEITSMTTGRNKTFNTSVGTFSYRHLNLERYKLGLTREEFVKGIDVSIATPEKALADLLYTHKEKVKSATDLLHVCEEHYRIDIQSLAGLNIKNAKLIAKAYKHATITLLPDLINEAKAHV